jgi:hypothetical protein
VLQVNRNPTQQDIHGFGWAMLGGFTFLSILSWTAAWRSGAPLTGWSGAGGQIAAVSLALLGVLLFLVSRAAVSVAKHVYLVWMTVGLMIGIAVSTILLTFMFLLALPLFSLIVRAGDPLRKKVGKSASYWQNYKPHEPTLDRMRRLF